LIEVKPPLTLSPSRTVALHDRETDIDALGRRRFVGEAAEEDLRRLLADLGARDRQRREAGDDLRRDLGIVEAGDGDPAGHGPTAPRAFEEDAAPQPLARTPALAR
jgi:hypothetical protein